MKNKKVLQTGFNPDISNCISTNSAFFFREDTADTVSLSNLMIYNNIPILDIIQEEKEVKPEKS